MTSQPPLPRIQTLKITEDILIDCPVCNWKFMKLTEQSKHRQIGSYCERCHSVYIYVKHVEKIFSVESITKNIVVREETKRR